MDTTCYTFPYIPQHHYPWCSGLRPRPCRISCRQNIYFCLIRRLIRPKYHNVKTLNMQILRQISTLGTIKLIEMFTSNISPKQCQHGLCWLSIVSAKGQTNSVFLKAKIYGSTGIDQIPVDTKRKVENTKDLWGWIRYLMLLILVHLLTKSAT